MEDYVNAGGPVHYSFELLQNSHLPGSKTRQDVARLQRTGGGGGWGGAGKCLKVIFTTNRLVLKDLSIAKNFNLFSVDAQAIIIFFESTIAELSTIIVAS